MLDSWEKEVCERRFSPDDASLWFGFKKDLNPNVANQWVLYVFSVAHVLPVIFGGEALKTYTAAHHRGAYFQHAAADKMTQWEVTEWKKTGMHWKTRKILLIDPELLHMHVSKSCSERQNSGEQVMLSATRRHIRPTASTFTQLVKKKWPHRLFR